MAYTKKQKTEIFEHVLHGIAEDGLSLRHIIRKGSFETEDGEVKLPSLSTFMKWLNDETKESEQYARAYSEAMNLRADKHFEEIIMIADNVGQDVVINEDGLPVVNHGVIQRDRLRVDARKWILSKMNPKKYGDKLEVDAKVENIKPIMLIPPPEEKE